MKPLGCWWPTRLTTKGVLRGDSVTLKVIFYELSSTFDISFSHKLNRRMLKKRKRTSKWARAPYHAARNCSYFKLTPQKQDAKHRQEATGGEKKNILKNYSEFTDKVVSEMLENKAEKQTYVCNLQDSGSRSLPRSVNVSRLGEWADRVDEHRVDPCVLRAHSSTGGSSSSKQPRKQSEEVGCYRKSPAAAPQRTLHRRYRNEWTSCPR